MNIEHLPKKSKSDKQNKLKRETTWATTKENIGIRLPKLSGIHIPPACAPGGRYTASSLRTDIKIYVFHAQFCSHLD